MEDELILAQRRIAACEQEQETLQDRRKELQASAADFDSQLDLCFASGKDDLARGIIRRKLEAQRLLQRLDSRLEANDRFLQRQRQLLEESRATLEGLRQKADLIVADNSADGPTGGPDEISRAGRGWQVGEDEIEVAFLREKAARSRS
jgi:phage shock protein A